MNHFPLTACDPLRFYAWKKLQYGAPTTWEKVTFPKIVTFNLLFLDHRKTFKDSELVR